MEAKLLALVKSLLYLRRIQEPPLKFKTAEFAREKVGALELYLV